MLELDAAVKRDMEYISEGRNKVKYWNRTMQRALKMRGYKGFKSKCRQEINATLADYKEFEIKKNEYTKLEQRYKNK